jgi:hypothetical protein
LTISEYLSGARPLVGTVGACGLMLLACSWFVLGPGDLGRSHDVGTPAPVLIIGDPTGERAAHAVPAHHGTPSQGARSRDVSAKRSAVARASIAPLSQPSSAPAVASTQSPSTAPAAPSPTAPPPTPGMQAAQAAPEPPAVTTPPLPAPLDGLPEVTLPPIPAAVPLPDVSTVTTPLGLP